MPLVFKGFDRSKRLNILDLGSAEPQSIAFYHHFFARICVVDAVDQWTSSAAPSLLESMPDDARGLRFDVCLLWDTLSHLTGADMAKVAAEMAGCLHEGSRIHAIAAYTSAWAFDAHRYGIISHREIAINPSTGPVPHPHSQTEIERALPDFHIKRTVLRPGNRLELLLTGIDH